MERIANDVEEDAKQGEMGKDGLKSDFTGPVAQRRPNRLLLDKSNSHSKSQHLYSPSVYYRMKCNKVTKQNRTCNQHSVSRRSPSDSHSAGNVIVDNVTSRRAPDDPTTLRRNSWRRAKDSLRNLHTLPMNHPRHLSSHSTRLILYTHTQAFTYTNSKSQPIPFPCFRIKTRSCSIPTIPFDFEIELD